VESLPPEVVEAVNRKLVEGYTYQQVTDWLNQLGHEVGKSSVARYGKDFLARLERLRVAKEQARAIVEETDRPATEMHEAANRLAVHLIMETLMQVNSLDGERLSELLKALAQLERSAVSREHLKLEYKKKVQQAVSRIEEAAQARGLDPETLRVIKEQVYGII
jgi:hypothetical protein